MKHWMVGSGKVDITPPLFVPELGFVPRQHSFRGVHDRLTARALALSTDTDGVLIIAADCIGFHWSLLGDHRDFVGELRRRLSRICGLTPDRIMLAATHAHSTPETLCLTPFLKVPGVAEWVE
ncbi:MAG: hypothetical protein NZ959_03210, partial [Armatimonadetes bacterium]|nr:hypothetical protein [Armatimonadota bacterium]MDW8121540.1 hypothetical protein [Armatimonadota bacterium]